VSLRRPMLHVGPFIAAVLVALWVVSPFAWAAHARQHAHRFCPEHASFEEADCAQDTQPLASDSRGGDGLRSGAPWDDAGPSGNAHEECPAVAFEASAPWTVPARSLVGVLEARTVLLVPELHARPFEPMTALVRAPKASPPADAT
jgi:hypothetical protein